MSHKSRPTTIFLCGRRQIKYGSALSEYFPAYPWEEGVCAAVGWLYPPHRGAFEEIEHNVSEWQLAAGGSAFWWEGDAHSLYHRDMVKNPELQRERFDIMKPANELSRWETDVTLMSLSLSYDAIASNIFLKMLNFYLKQQFQLLKSRVHDLKWEEFDTVWACFIMYICHIQSSVVSNLTQTKLSHMVTHTDPKSTLSEISRLMTI